MAEIKAKKAELKRVVKELVKMISLKQKGKKASHHIKRHLQMSKIYIQLYKESIQHD